MSSPIPPVQDVDPWAKAPPAPAAPAAPDVDPWAGAGPTITGVSAQPDTRTGAPIKVRLAIAAAGTPEDQLAVAKKYLPNARMMNGKLVFDGEGGVPTLVTPKFFGNPNIRTDLESLLTAPGKLGASLGAMLGGIIGTPADVVSGPVGTLTGAAAGGLVGGQTGNLIQKALAALVGKPVVDTRSPLDLAGGMTQDAVSGAGQEAGGALLGHALAPVGQGIAARVADAARSNTPLTVAQATDRIGPRVLQSILGYVPTGRIATLPFVAEQNAALGSKAEELAGQIAGGGAVPSVEDAGNLAKQAAARILTHHNEAIQTTGNAMYAAARKETPRIPLTPEIQDQINSPDVRAALQRAIHDSRPGATAGTMPKFESPFTTNGAMATDANADPKVLADLRATVYKAHPELQPNALSGGRMSVPEPTTSALLATPAGQSWAAKAAVKPDMDPATLDAIVTHLGEMSGSAANKGRTQWARGLNDLKSAMLDQVRQHAPLFADARDALAQQHADFRGIPVPGGPGFWDKVANATPDQAFKLVTNLPNNAQAVQAIRDQMGSDFQPIAARHFLDLGHAAPGAQGAPPDLFSPDKFLTQWNKMSPESQDAMYAGLAPADRRAFINTVAGIKKNPLPNPSGTGGAVLGGGTLNKVMESLGGLGGVVQGGAGAQAVAHGNFPALLRELAGPYALAKINTAQPVVRGLSRAASGVGDVGAALERLFPMAKAAERVALPTPRGPLLPPGGLVDAVQSGGSRALDGSWDPRPPEDLPDLMRFYLGGSHP